MTGMQRYDHPRMLEHSIAQANMVNRMMELKGAADNTVRSVAEIWTQHGSNAAQECHAQIALAFTQVFDTISRHGTAINGASQHAETTDFGAAAGFKNI
jgi:uncharacterized protein YukE